MTGGRAVSAAAPWRQGVATVALLLAMPAAASAQSPLPGGLPPPPGMSMPVYAQHRFPQPVVVGSLVGELVQRPVPSQQRLGIVHGVVRRSDGELDMVIRYGGLSALGSRIVVGGREIAVPVDAMALLGPVVEVVGFSPRQLDRFPTYAPDGAVALPEQAVIRVGLTKPSH